MEVARGFRIVQCQGRVFRWTVENVNLIYKKWIDTAPHKDLSVHCCTDIDVSDGGLLCVAA